MPHFPLGLTMGMMLSMPMVLVGAWLIWRGAQEPPAAGRRAEAAAASWPAERMSLRTGWRRRSPRPAR